MYLLIFRALYCVFRAKRYNNSRGEIDQPNKETMAAMLEAERIAKDPNVKHYSDVEEALRELKR